MAAHDSTFRPAELVDLSGFDIDRLGDLAGPVSGAWTRRIAAWIGHSGTPLSPALARVLGGPRDLATAPAALGLYIDVSPGGGGGTHQTRPAVAPTDGARLVDLTEPVNPGAAERGADWWTPVQGWPAERARPAGTHRVTGADIDAVAGGRARPALLAELARGQVSRRMLLLWALLRGAAVIDLDSATRACLAESARVLGQAQRRAPAAVRATLLHPGVGVWLADAVRRCWRSAAGENSDLGPLGHAGGIAAAAAVRAGVACRLPVRVIDGLVSLPTVGTATVEDAGGSADPATAAGPLWALATVTVDGDGRHLDLTIDGPGALGWLGRQDVGAPTGGGLGLLLEGADPFRVGDALPAGVAAAASPAATARWDRLVLAAGALLADTGPDLVAEVAGTLHTLVPMRPVVACHGSSATATDSLGTALLSPPSSPLALAASLVHESAHSRLEMVHDLAALVCEDAGRDALYFSPWRPDPRPLAAVLQGTFAHARMAAFWAARWTSRSCAADPHVAYEFAWCREALRAALPALRCADGLTVAGRRVVAVLAAACDDWEQVAVAGPVALAVREVLLDLTILWRLRNHRPDPRQVAGWARDWLTGRPCGRPCAPRSTVAPARPGAFVTRHARHELHARRYAEPDSGRLARWPAGATAGDVLAVSGDRRAAAAEFRRELREQPGRLESFAGLALIHADQVDGLERRLCTEHPDAVLALAARIRAARGRAPDLAALTAWIAAGAGRAIDAPTHGLTSEVFQVVA